MAFKILVIDDQIHDKTDTISALPELLQAAGYEVVTSADGDTAYDLVFEHKPDLIVLDICFDRQEIDGIEICRAIRSEDFQVPIILITGIFTETADVLAGFEAGACDYVIKPCDNREILARISLGPISVNRLLVAQRCSNVIHNAIKYSLPGGVVDVALRLEGEDSQRVTVEVRDRGRGIEAKDQECIFQLDVRGDGLVEPGSGLGLYCARQIARLHGGDLVLVESRVNEGSTFRIILPYQ